MIWITERPKLPFALELADNVNTFLIIPCHDVQDLIVSLGGTPIDMATGSDHIPFLFRIDFSRFYGSRSGLGTRNLRSLDDSTWHAMNGLIRTRSLDQESNTV